MADIAEITTGAAFEIDPGNGSIQEFALEIRRDWAPLLACGAALGLSEAQLDALFAQAATL